MAKIWHGGYWVGKAKEKKNSPWVLIILVVAALWVWGHTMKDPGDSHPAPRPSSSSAGPSASAHANP